MREIAAIYPETRSLYDGCSLAGMNLKMPEADSFASRLASLIKEQGMSHAEVGRAVGVSGQAVGKWAKGGNIEYDNLQMLARLFGVNWIWLRYGDDAMISFSERRTGSKTRRAVIREIVDNEERLRLALEGADIGVWDMDLISDQVVLSGVAERLLGVEPGGFHGGRQALLQLVHGEDHERVAQALERVLEDRAAHFDVVHRLAGREVRLRQRGRLFRDEAGRPVRVLTVLSVAE